MTEQEMKQFMEDVIFPQLLEVRGQAHREYAHEDNTFANFERLATELHEDRKKVLWIYLRKHLDGILAGINGHTSQREPISGRCKDAMMYLSLLWAMFQEEGQ